MPREMYAVDDTASLRERLAGGVRCGSCGAEELDALDVLEIMADTREFTISTCCSDMYEYMIDEMAEWTRHDWRDFFDIYAGKETRAVFTHDAFGNYRLDFGLKLRSVDLKTAKAFVAEHHAHHKPSLSWRWGHGVYNGAELVGVAMVGRPVARMIDGTTTVEVTRLCVSREAASALVWNACSMLYGAAAREAKRRGFERIITYVLESEAGTTLGAAGWTRETMTRGGSWNRPGRARTDTAPTCRKWRWGRELRRRRIAR